MPSSKQKAIQRNRDGANAKKAAKAAPVAEAAVKEVPAEKAAETATPQITNKTRVRGGPSIRKLINTLLAEGKSTDEIGERLQEDFPGTQAALKYKKHVSFYRSKMRKEQPGLLPDAGAKADEPTTVVTAKKGVAKSA